MPRTAWLVREKSVSLTPGAPGGCDSAAENWPVVLRKVNDIL